MSTSIQKTTTWFFNGQLPLNSGDSVKIDSFRSFSCNSDSEEVEVLGNCFEVGRITILSSNTTYESNVDVSGWEPVSVQGTIIDIGFDDDCTIFELLT